MPQSTLLFLHRLSSSAYLPWGKRNAWLSHVQNQPQGLLASRGEGGLVRGQHCPKDPIPKAVSPANLQHHPWSLGPENLTTRLPDGTFLTGCQMLPEPMAGSPQAGHSCPLAWQPPHKAQCLCARLPSQMSQFPEAANAPPHSGWARGSHISHCHVQFRSAWP